KEKNRHHFYHLFFYCLINILILFSFLQIHYLSPTFVPMKQLFSAILFFIPFLAISQNDKLHSVFVENFADSTSNYFRYGSTGNKSGFKYKFGVNSLTEAGTNILSFKIDPQDSAGAGRGP